MKKIICCLLFFCVSVSSSYALTLEDIEHESKIRSYCRLKNIDNIPLNVKIEQMLFLTWDIDKINQKEVKTFLKNHHIGGLAFNTHNSSTDKKIKGFLSNLQEHKNIAYFTSLELDNRTLTIDTLKEIGINTFTFNKKENDTYKEIYNCLKMYNKNSIILIANNFNLDKKVNNNPYLLLITQGKFNQIIIPSNIINNNIDPHNYYCLSSIALNNYIKKELNFQGLILNNSLTNSTITNNLSLNKIVIEAIKSGNNMLLYNGYTLENNNLFIQNVTQVIQNGLKNNVISIHDINKSYIKIIELKHQFCLIPRENWC